MENLSPETPSDAEKRADSVRQAGGLPPVADGVIPQEARAGELSSAAMSPCRDPAMPQEFWRNPEVLLVRPARGWQALNLVDVWRNRELLYFLAWRDIKVRYKQTVLGMLWAILQPVLTMAVFAIFFGRLAGIDQKISVPYPLFAFCALLPWQLFAFAIGQSTNSLVSNERLITKVYFPRIIIPMSSVFAGLSDFTVSFFVLALLLCVYGIMPSAAVLFIIPLIVLAILTALGVGVWLSALNVKYRDVRYTVPFLTQLWLFVTPIAYPSSLVPEKWRIVYAINPMAGVVEGFRWSLLGSGNPPGIMLLVSTLAAMAILLSGMYYFRRVERTFADVV